MRLSGLPRVPERLDIPVINITGLTGYGTSNFPAGWFQTNFNYKNVFSWIQSAHTIKMGGELRYVRSNSYNTPNYIPTYQFPNILDFAYDDPLQVTRKVDPSTGIPATNVVGLRGKEWALFINDDWKVSRTLTINLGLRYENFGSPTEVNGLLRNFVFGQGNGYFDRLAAGRVDIVPTFFPTDNNDWAPRIGFAWNPDGRGRTAIRGGYGIASDRLFMTPLLEFRNNPPLRADATLGRQFGTQALYSLGDVSKPYLGYPIDPALALGLDPNNGIKGVRVGLRAVNPNLRTSYIHNWFFGIQRDLGRGVIVEANYLGSAGHKLYNVTNVNRFAGDLLTDNLFNGWNRSFSSVDMIESSSNSIHHGGTLQVRKMFSAGLTLQSAFTFGKTINDSDDLVSTSAFQNIGYRHAERAVAGYDVPRKFSWVAVYDLPFLRSSRSFAGAVLGGWQLSSTGILQAGNPITVFMSAPWPRGDYNADGFNNDRPNAPAANVPQNGWERSDYQKGIFSVVDFPVPAPGTDGNLGRNRFRGPGYAQVDLSLAKKFRITERFAVQFRADAFNAFNRVNLNNPVTDLVNNNFGRSVGTQTPKSYQLGLRVMF
jgi:hypothetical protein